jgi:hypothetical protein
MRYLFQRSFLTRLLLGFVFISVPAVAVNAEPAADAAAESPMDVGIAAVEKEDYDKAFSVFLKLAKAGNAEAQYNLAMLYRAGKGTKKDLSESFRWFKQAAEQGISDAQYYLAYMYDNGEGVGKDLQKAFEWYRKAAEHGQGLAQINLGVIYANGLGVPQDINQAYLWFHAAAAQGYTVALENRKVIEEALKEQGEPGETRLKHLKEQAHGFFQQYVQPFESRSVHPKGRMPPPSQH